MNKKKAFLTGLCLAAFTMFVAGASIDYRALNPTQFTTSGIVRIKSGALVTNLTGTFIGDGSGLTNLSASATNINATNITAGTLPDGRFPAILPAASGVNLTALNATSLASGTVPDARFPA